jgi:hypothetical protein
MASSSREMQAQNPELTLLQWDAVPKRLREALLSRRRPNLPAPSLLTAK